MIARTARAPDKPDEKRRPGTGRRSSGSNSSNSNYNGDDWSVQLLLSRYHLSAPFARVVATILFGEARDA